ncbi:MAG: hypothetical protein GY811_18250 [Myxococcales bacterium]|nr:hypothetical protein [Myxococcales bacterium]
MSESAESKTEDDSSRSELPSATARGPGPLSAFYRSVAPYELAFVIGIALVVLLTGMSSYTLIDPWETHYAEVARRMLEGNDWVHLQAENQSFRSKPVLTFWLIAGSMQTLGVATDGGYSGELTDSAWVIFSIRLPFALFGVLGLTMLWSMLAKLVNRRVAWVSFLVLLSSPFYFMVARQAITDMPMVASLIGAIACFSMAVHGENKEIRPFWKRVTALHVLIAAVLLIVGAQLVYLYYYFGTAHPGVAQGVRLGPLTILIPMTLLLIAWLASMLPQMPARIRFTVRNKQQLNMLWFFLFIGITVLAKGPPGIALAGLICLLYILITGEWKLLLKLELVRGPILTALIALPWHFAMFLKDGPAWSNEYINHHMLNRFGKGVHGDSGTFDYFASQLGIGMWPWIALLPAALLGILYSARKDTRDGRVRLLVGIWAIAGFATFCASETKFHHYVLPVVPALAVLVGFWLDDFLSGRHKRSTLAILVGIPIAGLLARDFVGEQKQIMELSIYRYDRPWPSGEPWFVDTTTGFMVFGTLISLLLVVLCIERLRRFSVPTLLSAGMAFGLWVMHSYTPKAAAHWGQRALHRTYYAKRQIHGVDYQYYSLRDLADDWKSDSKVLVESVIPDEFPAGAPMRIQIFVPGAGIPDDRVILNGAVASIGKNKFWIEVPASERAKLSDLVARGAKMQRAKRRPWKQVNADRMVAWQLNWHGEDFWTAGEMYGHRDDAKSIFKSTKNDAFLKWIEDPERAGRTYFIVTEAGRARGGLRGVLPTPRAKKTHEILDTSCNKFSLVRFSL